MYVPKPFEETDSATLFTLIEQHSFGLLVSAHDGEPFATHLPILLDRTLGPHGCLVGHMARANPHWEQADGKPVLAVFAGPHAYISPTWYEAAAVVPTWNYVAVHCYGTLRAIHDPDAMMEIVRQYVDFYEATMPQPWRLDEASEHSRKLVKAIVGFRVEISRIEGKWKLGQNHPRERREKVAARLESAGDENALAIAALIRKSLA